MKIEYVIYVVLFVVLLHTLYRIWKNRPVDVECDHLYYPQYEEHDSLRRYPLGQRCLLCGKFNVEQQLNRRQFRDHS